jgi:hypothetical protein
MGKTAIDAYLEQEIAQRKKLKEDVKLRNDAYRAQIELSKQNWAQRHYFLWALISALLGGAITFAIEKLAPLLLDYLKSFLG